MKVRPARTEEADVLSAIAWAAKAHWGYSPQQLEDWRADLTYTSDYIASHWVSVACDTVDGEDGVLGVCSLDPMGDQLDVGGLWVLPSAMGQGVGRQLLEAAKAHARNAGVQVIRLLSDPHAEGFYEKMGGLLIGHERGSTSGRLLPLFHFDV